jgi:hypothetical protein
MIAIIYVVLGLATSAVFYSLLFQQPIEHWYDESSSDRLTIDRLRAINKILNQKGSPFKNRQLLRASVVLVAISMAWPLVWITVGVDYVKARSTEDD